MSSPHLLILGAGSVGRRHLRNFAKLGCRVSAMDPRADRLDQAAGEVTLVGRFASLEAALETAGSFSGVVICSPPKFHVDQAILALEQRLPVLLEKPVSPELEDALRLQVAVKRAGVPLLLGYTYRWFQPITDFKHLVDSRKVGRPLRAHFTMSAHLNDWHPWERYQDFFMASRELGGGALLDESHFLDLMYWFFGAPADLVARVDHLSSLEIDTDDNVDLIATYADGLRVTMHLDLYGRPHEKKITVVGEQGTIEWNAAPNCVRFSNAMEGKWEETAYTCDRNDMFVKVAEEFLVLLARPAAPKCSIDDGVAVMRLVEACRSSAAGGNCVRLSP